MTRRMTEAEAAAVHTRSRGRCEIAAAPGCTGQAEQIHHRQGRGAGGTSDPDVHHVTALLDVCAPCHVHIESHRREAYGNGWAVRRNGVAVPAAVAVLLHDGRRVMLTDDGGYGPLLEVDVWDEFGHDGEDAA